MAAVGTSRNDGPPPEPSPSLDCHVQESDEVGYLFLEDGEAKLVSDGADGRIQTRTWIDVEWDACGPSAFDKKQHAIDPSTLERNDGMEGDACSRCDLVLYSDNDTDKPVKLHLKNPPYFNGTVPDMPSNQSTCSCLHSENRSDAALLAGVAFTCQFHGYISIRRIQVLFTECEPNVVTTNMSLVVTFAMPALTDPSQNVRRSILPSNKLSGKKQTASKPLPPSTQLLLAILRSDWDFLDKQMKRLEREPRRDECRPSLFVYQMQNDGSLKKAKRTLFPPKLSLEELYLRLRGVTTSELDADTRTSSLLAGLPQDILVTSIAPFLGARSIDALRRSNKLFHYALRSVVPGLKLRLYAHQVRSLEWMRRRETEELSEEEVLDFDSKFFGTESAMGDMHRAVTGGASVCLRLRASRKAFRIDQQTGIEILYAAPNAKGSFTLSRRIARGGLLCDDPGLVSVRDAFFYFAVPPTLTYSLTSILIQGKTITVLSLILQTSGLSTEPTNNGINVDTSFSHTDSDIFQAYWSEHVPYIFRRQGFRKILLTLRRQCPEARFFEFPVDPVKDSCPNYFDVIDKPISISEIEEKSIHEDYRFQDFQADVDRCFQ